MDINKATTSPAVRALLAGLALGLTSALGMSTFFNAMLLVVAQLSVVCIAVAFVHKIYERRNRELESRTVRQLTNQLGQVSELVNQIAEKERLKSIFAAMTDGIVLHQLDGEITEWNLAAERILGLTGAQICGRTSADPCWQAIREDGSELPSSEHPASVTLRTGQPIRDFVFGIRTPDDSRRWITVNTEPVRDAAGVMTAVVSSFADITAQRTQAERLRLIIEGSQIGTWDWNVVTGDVTFNDRWARMLGYELEELEPHVSAWERILDPDNYLEVWTEVQKHLDGSTAEYRNEMRLRRKDGTFAWILAVGRITERSATGGPVRMVGIHLDITSQKAIEEALVAAQVQADAASAAKTEFLANMSHEIRTPMTAILGFTDLLAHEIVSGKDSGVKLDFINTIRRNGEHLLQIINDILDISKIEAGKLLVENIDTPVAELVAEVLNLMRVKAKAKGLDLSVEFGNNIPIQIHSDPVRLRQILVNLVGNAIKFTELGHVTVKVECDRLNEELQISVVDTGIGLATEHLDRLFGAFEQGDASNTRKYGGTGLGLQISQRLARLLGGDIRVQSKLGQGSTFCVTIATGSLESVPSIGKKYIATLNDKQHLIHLLVPPTEAGRPLDRMRILLVEDGPDNQRLISHILRKAGAEVLIAENGQIALEMLCADGTLEGQLAYPCPVDLLLCDMQMPVLDGYSTAKLLRAKKSQIPIVALTANAMSSDLEKCISAGCNAYASKPIDKESLIAVCREWGKPRNALSDPMVADG